MREPGGACSSSAIGVDLLAEGEWSFQPLLWQRVRDVVVWADTPREERADLFLPGFGTWQLHAEREATEIKALAAPIRVLSALVRYPDVVHPEDVSAACIEISHWAEANHLTETALNFAEAAGIANPWDPHAAAHAGQLCARYATDGRAEVWYERGIRIGRRMGNWEWYIRSNLRLGILHYEQGDFRSARTCYGRARSKAIWAGLPAFAGKAHHDMLLISIAVGSFTNGDDHARRALDYYPIRYERLPQLAHDYAVLLSTFHYNEQALRILNLVLPMITLACERIAVLGTIAKAAAGIGAMEQYERAVNDVVLFSSMSDLNAAGALALASEGAAVLGKWEQAEQLARLGLAIAVRRREREPQRRATAVLRAVATHSAPAAALPRQGDQRAIETTEIFLTRLRKLGTQTTDAGALSRGRAELTTFTIAGR